MSERRPTTSRGAYGRRRVAVVALVCACGCEAVQGWFDPDADDAEQAARHPAREPVRRGPLPELSEREASMLSLIPTDVSFAFTERPREMFEFGTAPRGMEWLARHFGFESADPLYELMEECGPEFETIDDVAIGMRDDGSAVLALRGRTLGWPVMWACVDPNGVGASVAYPDSGLTRRSYGDVDIFIVDRDRIVIADRPWRETVEARLQGIPTTQPLEALLDFVELQPRDRQAWGAMRIDAPLRRELHASGPKWIGADSTLRGAAASYGVDPAGLHFGASVVFADPEEAERIESRFRAAMDRFDAPGGPIFVGRRGAIVDFSLDLPFAEDAYSDVDWWEWALPRVWRDEPTQDHMEWLLQQYDAEVTPEPALIQPGGEVDPDESEVEEYD